MRTVLIASQVEYGQHFSLVSDLNRNSGLSARIFERINPKTNYVALDKSALFENTKGTGWIAGRLVNGSRSCDSYISPKAEVVLVLIPE